MNRVGDWINTYKNIQFWPLDPRPEEISILDIAHALSNICRFGGHSKWFYCVAQHSYYVSLYTKPENALYGLLHDGPESFVGDCVRPLKPYLNNFQEIEDKIMKVIADKYGFSIDENAHADIKQADAKLLFTEARDLIHEGGLNWKGKIEPLNFEIIPWTPVAAKKKFLQRFHELTNNRWLVACEHNGIG